MAATFLTRFRGHLARHDWLAVGVDFLIVVVGVIVGIEASNWNQGRPDRSEERRYHAQIVRDLQQDLETFRIARLRSLDNDRSADRRLPARTRDSRRRRPRKGGRTSITQDFCTSRDRPGRLMTSC